METKWLPSGFVLPSGEILQNIQSFGDCWQIYRGEGAISVLVVQEWLANRWNEEGLIDLTALLDIFFGETKFRLIISTSSHVLAPVSDSLSNNDDSLAETFVLSLIESRKINQKDSFHDAIFVEKLSRVLPIYSITEKVSDDVVMGKWLTRGCSVSITSGRKFKSLMSWMEPKNLSRILQVTGASDLTQSDITYRKTQFDIHTKEGNKNSLKRTESGLDIESNFFIIPGRKDLTQFFRDHVIDIVQYEDQYSRMGIAFPAPFILYGLPGTGKTYAVERLSDFLGWPLYEVNGSSIGSPYIHETSKKIAAIFDKAIENSPSLIVIDEMDAYLSERSAEGGKHSVEEVSEFLRLIPVARDNKVLVIGMTNRMDSIDPAILRKGRFDNLVHVDKASLEEVRSLLDSITSNIPICKDFDAERLARNLHERPLSDVSYVIREAGRLAAKERQEMIFQDHLDMAISKLTANENSSSSKPKIGFI